MRLLFIIYFWVIGLSIYAQESNKTDFSIADLWKNYCFYPETVVGLISMRDGVHYTALQGDTLIVKYSYKTGNKVGDILSIRQLKNDSIAYFSDYYFNSDETKLIFYINRKRVYRRSFTAQYYVWDIAEQRLYSVSNKKEQQLATLSPDGTKAAFVYKNNIYITDLKTGIETQITTDGEFNKIINGIPDWVYEEEFTFNQAFRWSPNGEFLAYCKWDETQVHLFNMTLYEGQYPQHTRNALYPENYAYKYPKSGEDNAVVSVHCYQLETKKTIKVDVGDETDQYIPRLLWSPKGDIVFYRFNRLQNHIAFLYAKPTTGQSRVFYTEENKYYIDEDYFDYLTFIDSGNKFIYASERNGFLHLYLHEANGTIINQITKGDFDVTAYYGINEQKHLVYYQSAETSPLERQVYAINLDGTHKKKLTPQTGTSSAVFSTGFKYFIQEFSNVNTPPITTLNNINGNVLRVLKDNSDFNKKLAQKNFSAPEFFSFTTNDTVQLNGFIIKPIGFDAEKKYPVIISQYSGPNSQEVLNSFSVGWEQVLASKGFLVVSVDPRGTGARGEEFRKCTYLQLGKYETIDIIETAKYLGGLAFVDSSRIGIWGWSYGGFMSLNALTQGADYFKAGIAVAPVTNWRYYDNIYTERFMHKPQDNADGYDLNSPINHVDKLKGKLLLIHGTADDNVHLQNSLEFSEALVQANKQFEQFYYTNRNHSIYGGNTRYHLFTKMVNFFVDNL